jgi:hypothetical protein
MSAPHLRIEDRVAPENRTNAVPQHPGAHQTSGPVLKGSNARSSTGGPEARYIVEDTTKRKLLTYQLAAVVVCTRFTVRYRYSKVLVTVCCPRGDRVPTPTLLQNFVEFHPHTGTIDATVLADSYLYRSLVQH